VPAANNIFVNWTGPGITNTANPLPLSMTTNRYITANFAYDYGAPGITRADYRFQNTLASSVGTPPDLSLISTGQFFTNIVVDGTSRTVLRFPQDKSVQLLPTTPVFPSNAYTAVILFRFDTVAGWRRLLDLKNAVGDQGLYVQDGKLNVYPASQVSSVCITNDTWHQVVVTRDATGIVNIYSDGVPRITYNDAAGYLTVSSAAAMRFYKDEGSTEESAGYVARIRNFATALSASEVLALDREPGSFAGPFILSNAKLNAQNQFYFTVTGPAGVQCTIQASTNFVTWSALTNIATFPGSMNYTSPATSRVQFFRVKQ
jgi:Concanavalin A-like lectin/glucanases superfamily